VGDAVRSGWACGVAERVAGDQARDREAANERTVEWRMSVRAVEVWSAPWVSGKQSRIEVQRVDASCSWQTRPVNLPRVGHRNSSAAHRLRLRHRKCAGTSLGCPRKKKKRLRNGARGRAGTGGVDGGGSWGIVQHSPRMFGRCWIAWRRTGSGSRVPCVCDCAPCRYTDQH
jgi:hypothetical protein